MQGIFGFFDPSCSMGVETLLSMSRAMGGSFGRNTAIEQTPVGGIGIIKYTETPLVSVSDTGVSYVVYGQLDSLGAGVGGIPPDDIAKHCFGGEAPRDLDNIRGSFVSAIYNPYEKAITLINDRFGGHPIYLFNHEAVWYFASQLKAILAVLPVKATVDQDSVATMLSIGEVVGDRTLIEGLSVLPAASVVKFSSEGKQSYRYWEYTYQEQPDLNWQDSVVKAGEALLCAVRRNTHNAQSLAVPLSGGLDSRFVFDIASQVGKRPKAYTWGVSDCRDIRYARDITRRLDCPHEVYTFQSDYLATLAERGVWLTEGHTSSTNFHVLPYVDTLYENGHDVLLDGFAGDVVLGGNFISSGWLNSDSIESSSKALWQWRRKGFDNNWHHHGLKELQEKARKIFSDTYCQYPGNTPMDKAMSFLIDNRLRRTTTCGTEIFRSKLHVRQPFMDVDFMDAICNLPHRWRIRHRFYLDVIRQFAPLSAAAPYQRTMLPASSPYWVSWFSLGLQRALGSISACRGVTDIVHGKSPSDFPAWFRGPLRSWAESILLDEKTLDRGVIPADVVRGAVSLHMNGGSNLSSQIGTMISLELFFRLFLDDLERSIKQYSEVGVSGE